MRQSSGLVLGIMVLLCQLAMTCSATPVGKLPAALSVSAQGQASYSIPIKVPAGANGMQPKFSVNYSSTTSRGLLGVGWSLGGVSAVSRCSKQAVLDIAYSTNVTLTATDKLCLDGTRLLSGGAAANATSVNLGTVTTYTTALQSYKKITATIDTLTNDQPQALTVTTKDGSVLTYGGSIDSRVLAAPVFNQGAQRYNASTNEVLSWMLSDVKDRNGNTMHYTYVDDSASPAPDAASINSSSAWLSSVIYTSNTGTSPAQSANKAVCFDYVDDATAPYGFLAGSRVRNNKLLGAVRINVNSTACTVPTVTPAPNEVRRYTFTYRATPSQLTQRPLPASVQQCDTYSGSQQCLNPTTFTWEDGQLNFSTAVVGPAWADTPGATSAYDIVPNTDTTGKNPTPNSAAYCLQNFNNSVESGVCMTQSAVGTWNGDPSYFTTVKLVDIDGDGKADICANLSTGVECHLSTGAGFGSAITAPTVGTRESNYGTMQFADLNGDGMADLCSRKSTGLVCYLRNL